MTQYLPHIRCDDKEFHKIFLCHFFCRRKQALLFAPVVSNIISNTLCVDFKVSSSFLMILEAVESYLLFNFVPMLDPHSNFMSLTPETKTAFSFLLSPPS